MEIQLFCPVSSFNSLLGFPGYHVAIFNPGGKKAPKLLKSKAAVKAEKEKEKKDKKAEKEKDKGKDKDKDKDKDNDRDEDRGREKSPGTYSPCTSY